jgi:hypothetical protein
MRSLNSLHCHILPLLLYILYKLSVPTVGLKMFEYLPLESICQPKNALNNYMFWHQGAILRESSTTTEYKSNAVIYVLHGMITLSESVKTMWQ